VINLVMNLLPFFDAWDRLEAFTPFGVAAFAPLFMEHGVAPALAMDVDECLFLDLIPQRFHGVRRIKIEARVSRAVFWVYVDLNEMLVSFQSNPQAPLVWSTPLDPPSPMGLVSIFFQHHRSWERRLRVHARCFPHAQLMTPSKTNCRAPRSE